MTVGISSSILSSQFSPAVSMVRLGSGKPGDWFEGAPLQGKGCIRREDFLKDSKSSRIQMEEAACIWDSAQPQVAYLHLLLHRYVRKGCSARLFDNYWKISMMVFTVLGKDLSIPLLSTSKHWDRWSVGDSKVNTAAMPLIVRLGNNWYQNPYPLIHSLWI